MYTHPRFISAVYVCVDVCVYPTGVGLHYLLYNIIHNMLYNNKYNIIIMYYIIIYISYINIT